MYNPPMAMAHPIITLTTDFGQADYYVAAMKAVLLHHCSEAQLVDVTHQVPPQDVLAGSIVLERAITSFPAGTTHLAVVDPGVGTSRRILVVWICDQVVVCPDNGLITWALRRMHGPSFFSELIWRPQQFDRVFHGRDIMAPAAGRIASGEAISAFTQPINNPILLDIALASPQYPGRVIHIDHFGNITSNIPQLMVEQRQGCQIVARGQNVGPVRQTYGDVPTGEPLALIGSSGLLEIAVRDGSAARLLGLHINDPIEVH